MSTLSKFRRLRAGSKTTKKNNIILYLKITPHKIQKPHPTPDEKIPVENKIKWKCTFSADSRATQPKIYKNRAPNEKLPTQICNANWLVSMRDDLASKDI